MWKPDGGGEGREGQRKKTGNQPEPRTEDEGGMD